MRRWEVLIGATLLALSAAVYRVQILLFNNTKDTLFYLFQDLAFLPIQVLIVTVILSELLTRRERRELLRKLNMLIGAFFSEVGTKLLRRFIACDSRSAELKELLLYGNAWDDRSFGRAVRAAKGWNFEVKVEPDDLDALRGFLAANRQFLLGLLANPSLLEHEHFTELMWAVFHLTEELSVRPTVYGLPDEDYQHLTLDIQRAYSRLVLEWLRYMKHLQADYPYLFAFALRENPFDAPMANGQSAMVETGNPKREG